MPNYIPSEVLPIYPTYSTVIKNGVKYKAYFETDWHQVITEDGVPLCDLIRSMPTYSDSNFYRYCGLLKTSPSQSGIDKLYALTTQTIGDIYLVETDMIVDGGRVCETYVWLGNENGWIYSGTTNRKASINRDLPDVIKLFPDDLGEPGEALIVSADGKNLAWGKQSINAHNADTQAHKDIRDQLNLKADKLIIFNDTLSSSSWSYNGEYPCFEYIYTNDKLPKKSYFEISTVVESQNISNEISSAGISPTYKIEYGTDEVPYCILRAKRVPNINIDICVKVFGTYEEK